MDVKRYWEKMTQYRKIVVLRERHLLADLSTFPYNWIPDDLKVVLKREMKAERYIKDK